MKQTPAQQWTALSALYEQADEMTTPALAAFLVRLEGEQHPLLPQLKRMLEARAQIETDDFLSTLPRLTPLPMPAQTGWHAGSRVGRYRLVRPLGEGGMAEVWLAERDDGAFKRQVAIKLPFPRPGRHSFAARFDRERDILASLRHPNIAGLFDAGVTPEGQAWIALEYVEGQAISAFCDERRLDLRQRMLLFRQVLLAVQHAHANLVIHRDLKPANILVTPQGEARLLDFGIAKLLESEGDAMPETELTRAAGRSLTPRYASPEQLNGLPLTTACDVYSLGVVFYELMCGEGPYEVKTDSIARMEQAVLEVEPRAPSRRTLGAAEAEARSTTPRALARTLSPEIDAIALRCLAKQTSGRYPSVDAVLADVDRWLNGEAVLARAPGAWYRTAKFAARHRLGVGFGVAAIASLIGITTVAVVLGLQAREESARAGASRDFMLSLFKRADQEKARGANITARELLDTGRKDVLGRLSGQPQLQAELLQGIATIQEEMGEFAQAEGGFAEVAAIYGRLGRPRETVLALVSQANSALRMGNPAKAKALIGAANNTPGRPLGDAEVNARLTAVDGWIAHIQIDPDRARKLFGESRAYAMVAYGPTHARTMDAVSGQVNAERKLGNFEAALRLLDELEAASEVAQVDAATRANLSVDRADLLFYAGRFAEGLAHTTTAGARCSDRLGSKHEWCKRLALINTKQQIRLGMLAEARRGLAAAQAYADDATSPAMQAEAVLLLLRLEYLSEPAGTDSGLFERVEAFALSGSEVAVNPALKMRAMLGLAEARLLRRDPVGARRWLGLAEELRRREPATRVALFDGVARMLGAIASLQSGGTDSKRVATDALGSLQSAQQVFIAVFGAEHPMVHLFRLNSAVVLRDMGRHDEAASIISAAEPALRRAFGEQSPIYQRVDRLRATVSNPVSPAAATAPRQPPEFFS